MINIKPIKLGNSEFEGENNAYLLNDGDDTVLIDTGFETQEVRKHLIESLNRRSNDIGDIDAIFLTHWHYDHAGLAGLIQEQSDATVYAHEPDIGLICQDQEVLSAYRSNQMERFCEWGLQSSELERMKDEIRELAETAGTPPVVEKVSDGKPIHQNGLTIEPIHTPGHTAGHCSYQITLEGEKVLFAGDVLLPEYTPNVGGTDVRVQHPLRRYMRTLRSLANRDFNRVFPGHRTVITDPKGRIREIIDHHRERTERIMWILDRTGPADARTVADNLFGELEDIHIIHGAGEAFAHLDHLRSQGVLSETDGLYRVEKNAYDFNEIISPLDAGRS